MSGDKGKRRQTHESNNNKENNITEGHEELSYKKLRKALNIGIYQYPMLSLCCLLYDFAFINVSFI